MQGERLGPYRIERELGSGGMGRVFAAVVAERTPGLETGATVALKVVHPHLLEQPGFFRRFLREAEIGAAVEHPNVVRTYLADALGHEHFLVMEYVEGQTLRELLDEAKRLLDEWVAHVDDETRTSMLTNLRLNREIMAAWREEFGDDGASSESVTLVQP